jgi:HKD family nuclease
MATKLIEKPDIFPSKGDPLNLLILLSQALQNNENLVKIIKDLKEMNENEKKEYIQSIENKNGINASSSLINLFHETKIRGLSESFLIELMDLRTDVAEIFPHKEPIAVITLPSTLKYNLPSSQLTGTISTMEAIEKIFELAKKEIIIITAFTSVSMANILGPLIANSSRFGKKITLITQPKNSDYDPEPALNRIQNIVVRNGNPELLSLFRMDLGAKGMMHLKILIADRNAALVGSANMTKGAMKDNIEAGFLVYGTPSAILSRTIATLVEMHNKNSEKPEKR